MRNREYQRLFSRKSFIFCLILLTSANCIAAPDALSQIHRFVQSETVHRTAHAGRVLLFFDLLRLARSERDKFFVSPVSLHRIALQIECADLSKFSTLFFRWLAHFGSTVILSLLIQDCMENNTVDVYAPEVFDQHLLSTGLHVANSFLLSVSLCRQMSDMLSRRYLQTMSLRDHHNLALRIEECPVCLGDESGNALVVPCEDARHAICGSCYQRLVEGREFYRCLFCNRIVPVQVIVEARPSVRDRVHRLEGTERRLLVMLFAMQVHILFFLILDLSCMRGYTLS